MTESIFIDSMIQHGLKIDRPVQPCAIEFLHDQTLYPVKVSSFSQYISLTERRDRSLSNTWILILMQKRRKSSAPSMLLEQMVSKVLLFTCQK